MDLKEKIELFFKTYHKEISFTDLIKKFKLNKEETEILADLLYELESNGKIFFTKNNKYIHIPKDFYLKCGVIKKSNKNKYYIISDGNVINISKKNIADAKENDIVYVEITKSEKHIKQIDGNIVRIVKRQDINNEVTFYKTKLKRNISKNYYYVLIDNNEIYIKNSDLKNAFEGDLISIQVIDDRYAKVIDIIERESKQKVLKLIKQDNKNVWVLADDTNRIIENIHFDYQQDFNENDYILVSIDENINFIKNIQFTEKFEDRLRIMYYNIGLPLDFSKEALEEIKKTISKCNIEDELKNRTDLRNLKTITIDGENAKDLDDAISLEYNKGIYTLYVHIADVSYFVRPETKLFEEAYIRATSIYPANYVFPMLPKELSNEICSLNQNQDRLTKTCMMKFDEEGNLLDYSIFNSIINSNYRMDYKSVNSILNDNIIPNGYEEYKTLLQNMNKLSNILQNRKIARGAICFDTIELEYILGKNQEIDKITDRNRGSAEILIENFMLAMNEIVTSYAFYLQVPFMYRNHDYPTVEGINRLKYKLEIFRSYLSKYKNINDPKILQKILLKIQKEKGHLEWVYYSNKVLSCMNRAYYLCSATGHYALALNYYGTVTSPIRRFPDLFNHYIIGEVLKGNINEIIKSFNKIDNMCKHCTDMQIVAENFEKQVNNILLKDYVDNFKNKNLIAQIIYISKNYLFVRTNELLYGKVYIKKDMYKKNYVVIDDNIYEIGDKINVRINDINNRNNEIEFNFIGNNKILRKERKIRK